MVLFLMTLGDPLTIQNHPIFDIFYFLSYLLVGGDRLQIWQIG